MPLEIWTESEVKMSYLMCVSFITLPLGLNLSCKWHFFSWCFILLTSTGQSWALRGKWCTTGQEMRTMMTMSHHRYPGREVNIGFSVAAPLTLTRLSHFFDFFVCCLAFVRFYNARRAKMLTSRERLSNNVCWTVGEMHTRRLLHWFHTLQYVQTSVSVKIYFNEMFPFLLRSPPKGVIVPG